MSSFTGHDIYGPLPSDDQQGVDKFLLEEQEEDIEFACNIRFHRSFILSPNPDKGRHKPLRVTYADAGYHDEGSLEDIPVMLYIGGIFGGRYQALTVDEIAKKYRVRILFVDRPGMGGTEKVPLERRISTWLDLVPALLKHVGVKHVALGSHSTGTIYLFNTLLYLRDILHPQKPYVAFFGPWVHPSNSGNLTFMTANMLPNQLIKNFHSLVKFTITTINPIFSFSGGLIDNLSEISGPFWNFNPQSVQESGKRQSKRPYEAYIIKCLFTEQVDGASEDALLCLKKGDNLWGEWENYDKAVPLIAKNEAERVASLKNAGKYSQEKLLVHVMFAESDTFTGKKGQEFFESCWNKKMRGEHIDFEGMVFPDTDHNGVCNPDKGCFDVFFKEIVSRK